VKFHGYSYFISEFLDPVRVHGFRALCQEIYMVHST
jgi:hypothetical protein